MPTESVKSSGVPEGDSQYYPRIILCFPGPWDSRADLEERLATGPFRLKEAGLCRPEGGETVQVQYQGADGRMKGAFQSSACRVRPSLSPVDFRAIEEHRSVLYVISERFDRSDALATAVRMLEVGQALVEAGAVGVKSEASGISHSWTRWKEMGDRFRKAGKPTSDAAWQVLFEAYVRLPIANETGQIYSCGMHMLGCPEGIVELGDFKEQSLLPAHRVLEGFLRTFGKSADSLLLPLQHTIKDEGEGRITSGLEPCDHYPPGHLFWNRWGCFRLRRSS